MTTLGSIRSPSTARSCGFMRRSTTSGASSVPDGVTTNTSDTCRSACCSTSCPSRQGRDDIRCTQGWSRVTPSARSPNTAATTRAAITSRKMVAPRAEPVISSRTIQHTTTAATIFHRLRFRDGREIRPARRAAPPCSLIDTPRYGFAISTVHGTWAVRTPNAALRMWSMPAVDARVNENGPSSRHLEVTDAQLSAVSGPVVGSCGPPRPRPGPWATADAGETGCRKRPHTRSSPVRMNGSV